MRKTFTLFAMAISLTTMARDFVFNDITYTVISENQKTVRTKEGVGITPGNNVTGTLTIPSTVNDGTNEYTVTEIGKFSFLQTKISGELVLPNTITNIGYSAFSGCSGLSGSLVIPNSVITIGDYAFNDCTGLDGTLSLSESLSEIGKSAFYRCRGLTGDLIIPNSVNIIGEYAFAGCRGLNGTLKISGSISVIPMSAFEKCVGLTGELKIPESVKSINSNAFTDCSGFTGTLIIPDNVENLGFCAFSGCSGFDEDLILSNSLTSIDYGTFYNCSNLKSIRFPKTLKKIIGYENSPGAFKNCSNLSGTLVIPDGVEMIGYYAFDGCANIENIVIGHSVLSIATQAFQNMGNLNSLFLSESVQNIGGGAFNATDIKEIIIEATTPPVVANSFAFSEKTYKDATITVPEESLELYRTAEVWKEFAHYKISGIDNIFNESAIMISIHSDGLTIHNAEGNIVNIYNLDGRMIDSFVPKSYNEKRIITPGRYIVKAGTKVCKVIIK